MVCQCNVLFFIVFIYEIYVSYSNTYRKPPLRMNPTSFIRRVQQQRDLSIESENISTFSTDRSRNKKSNEDLDSFSKKIEKNLIRALDTHTQRDCKINIFRK